MPLHAPASAGPVTYHHGPCVLEFEDKQPLPRQLECALHFRAIVARHLHLYQVVTTRMRSGIGSTRHDGYASVGRQAVSR